MKAGEKGYTLASEGEDGTLDYKLFFEKDGKRISPWHDIPLVANEEKGTYNVVIEIPKNTKAKMEISRDDENNPIIQDRKNGKVRFVEYKDGYMWNYGAFPQTWEDPGFTHPETGCVGDKDPLDVCEVGSRVAERGDVLEVKVLGVFALIDEGETDWKVLVVDVNDPLAEKLNDLEDIEREMPGYLEETHVWFRDYKTVVGKPKNTFAFEGKPKNKEYALGVVKENFELWQKGGFRS